MENKYTKDEKIIDDNNLDSMMNDDFETNTPYFDLQKELGASPKDLELIKRLEFSTKTRRILAERSGWICSNPDCLHYTIGPGKTDYTTQIIGEAAHIYGAIQNENSWSPRKNINMNPKDIKDISNGIWLCRNCHRLVDGREDIFSVEILKKWKKDSEQRMLDFLRKPMYEQTIKSVIGLEIDTKKGIKYQFNSDEWCFIAYVVENGNLDLYTFKNEYISWMQKNKIDSNNYNFLPSYDLTFNEYYDLIQKFISNMVGFFWTERTEEYAYINVNNEFYKFIEFLDEHYDSWLQKLIKDLSII